MCPPELARGGQPAWSPVGRWGASACRAACGSTVVSLSSREVPAGRSAGPPAGWSEPVSRDPGAPRSAWGSSCRCPDGPVPSSVVTPISSVPPVGGPATSGASRCSASRPGGNARRGRRPPPVPAPRGRWSGFRWSARLALLSLVAVSRLRKRFELLGGEVQVPAVPVVQLGRGVVGEGDRDVRLAVQVDVHGADPRLLAGEEHVLRARPPGRAQPDPAAAGYPRAPDQHGVGLRCDLGGRLGEPPVAAGQAGAGRLRPG